MACACDNMASEFSYDAICSKYGEGIPCPSDYSFPTHVIDRWARDQPDRAAIHWVSHDFKKERVMSYRELADASNRAAKAFQDQGLKKGDRFVVLR